MAEPQVGSRGVMSMSILTWRRVGTQVLSSNRIVPFLTLLPLLRPQRDPKVPILPSRGIEVPLRNVLFIGEGKYSMPLLEEGSS
jgi:hypothetical protein